MSKERRKRTDDGRSESADKADTSRDVGLNLGGLGGFFGKLGDLVGTLCDLAEKGKELQKSGEIKGLDPKGKLRGVYGVSVKVGLGEEGEKQWKMEPFGNIQRQTTGDTVVEDVREPLVDVHEEQDHVLILAEIPGVSKKDVQLDLSVNKLVIEARRGKTRYRKEVILPGSFAAEKMRWSCKNGILKIQLPQ